MISFYSAALICDGPPEHILNFYIVSDTNTKVIGNTSEIDSVTIIKQSSWQANIPEATWIWDKSSIQGYEVFKFEVVFAIPGLPSYGNLRVAFDNHLLGILVNQKTTECIFLNYTDASEKNCDVLNYLEYGINTMNLIVENTGGPGGLLYLLNISVLI